MSSAPGDTLNTALNPQSVAIIGASENPDKIGGARGHVTGAAGRLRAARQANASMSVDFDGERIIAVEISRAPTAVARGRRFDRTGPGAAARLRAARRRPPDEWLCIGISERGSEGE